MSFDLPKLPAGRIFAGRYAVQRPLEAGRGTDRYLALGEPSGEVLLEVFPCAPHARASVVAWLGDVRARLADTSARHVVPVLDHGVDESTGLAFVVSAWPLEPPLAELVSVCALTTEETAQLARALAASLGVIHRAGLLHLGLDTRNVFVPPLAKGTVVLAGVGVARAVVLAGGHPWDAADPPELGRGEGEPASDVFMTAGVLAAAAGLGDLAAGAEAFPAAMGAVLTRARAGAPNARFASPGDLAEALAAAAEGRAPTSRTMPVPAPASRPDLVAAPPPPPPPPPPPSRPELMAAPHAPPVATPLEVSVSPLSLGESSGRLAMESEPPVVPRRSRAIGAVVAGALALAAAVVVVLVVRGAGSSKRITSDTMASRGAPSGATPGVDSAAPPSAPSAAPPASATPVPPPPEPAPTPLGPDEAELTVTCTPDCDKVLVNNKPLAGYPEPVRMKAGTYGIGVGRAGHGGQWRKVVLPRGSRETVAFTLTPTHGAPGGGAAPAKPKANCGKFLKRCD